MENKMKVLERTIFKKKNEEIKKLQETIVEYQVNNINDNEKISKLENKNNLLEESIKKLENKIHSINSEKGAYIKQINRLNKIHQESINSSKNEIKMLKKELKETKLKLEESMTDKYLVRKIKPAKGNQKQTMKIKSGYIEGKIINKIKEEI